MAEKNKEFEDRIESEAKSASPIRCKDLVCKDCVFTFNDNDPFKYGTTDKDGRPYGPTSSCYKYDVKPFKVLLGGGCDKKKVE